MRCIFYISSSSSKIFLEKERERENRTLSHTVEYFKYFYYSNVLFYCCNYCTKEYSISFLAIFVNILMFVIFKLNSTLGMYNY
jgi:hypothetical protein